MPIPVCGGNGLSLRSVPLVEPVDILSGRRGGGEEEEEEEEEIVV